MFDMLLKVKEQYLSNEKNKENSSNYEKFSRDFAKFEEEKKTFDQKSKKEELFGRTFKM